MQTLAQIKDLLAIHGLSPRKSLGQNFLIDHNLIRKLVEASGAGPGDLVLEVGPGTGALTEALLDRGCEVVACELDRGLARLLRERFPRVTLVEGDCLKAGKHLAPELAGALGGRPFVMAANLPYNAASPLIAALLINHPECRAMFVTIQREVADRLLARPGSREYGTLGVLTQAMAEVERIAVLPPECFWPRPDVTSAMVSIRRRRAPLTDEPAGFAGFLTGLFSKRRKQLGAVLGRDRAWPQGITPTMRAEDLGVERLIELARVVL